MSSEEYDQLRAERRAAFLASEKACERCGQLFRPVEGRWPSEFAKKRFCSRECRGLAHRNTIERLLEQIEVNPQTGCHIWTGMKVRTGYGLTRLDNRWVVPHRAVWEHYKGPIPEGLQIDHMCGAKLCCNVFHLRVVTAQENSLAPTSSNMAARNARKTKCPNCAGEYSFWPNGHRYCKPCLRRNQSAYLRKKRAEGVVYERTSTHCPKCGELWHVTPKGQKYCQACRSRSRRAKRELNSQQGELEL